MNAIDEGMFNTALLKLDVDDRQEFRMYLNEVIAGRKDPTKEKYIPKNKEKFEEIVRQYPAIQGYIDFYVDKNKFKPDVQNNITIDGQTFDINDPKFQKEIQTNPKYA